MVRLKGVKPAPGEPDRRYYMIDFQEGNRRVRLSSGTRDKVLAERREQLALDAVREDINVPKETLLNLVRGSTRAAAIIQRNSSASPANTLKSTFDLVMHDKYEQRPKTRAYYTRTMNALFKFIPADTPINAIDSDMIEKAIRDMTHGKGAITGSTANRRLAGLSITLRYAAKKKLIVAPPQFDRPEENEPRSFVLDEVTFEAILANVLERDKRVATVVGGRPVNHDAAEYVRFFRFLAETGLRPSEALHLPWREVKWKDQMIHIRPSKVDGYDTKTGKARYVPLTEVATALLEEVRGKSQLGPFFDLTHRRANDHWLHARRAAGINDPECVPYSTRHTTATRLLEETDDIKMVQAWLGHSNIGLTSKVYAKARTGYLKKGAARLNDRRKKLDEEGTE